MDFQHLCPYCFTIGATYMHCGWKHSNLQTMRVCEHFSSNYIPVYLPIFSYLFSSLLQKMAHDLRTTLSPIYTSLLETLLSLLPRTISAPALTSLLETLSSVFRYLLIPTIDTNLIEETWSALCAVLPKCHGEIQRAVAEVWGGVLRRMKSGAREKAVELLAENTAAIEDASAWAVVYACKVCHYSLIMPYSNIPQMAVCIPDLAYMCPFDICTSALIPPFLCLGSQTNAYSHP